MPRAPFLVPVSALSMTVLAPLVGARQGPRRREGSRRHGTHHMSIEAFDGCRGLEIPGRSQLTPDLAVGEIPATTGARSAVGSADSNVSTRSSEPRSLIARLR